MPDYRMTDAGPSRFASRTIDGVLTPGDTVSVDAAAAATLEERDYFERVSDDPPTDDSDDADAAPEADAESAADDEAFDVQAFVDRTPVAEVAEDIRAGEADGHLDEVAEADDRTTTQDAIGERRAELEA